MRGLGSGSGRAQVGMCVDDMIFSRFITLLREGYILGKGNESIRSIDKALLMLYPQRDLVTGCITTCRGKRPDLHQSGLQRC